MKYIEKQVAPERFTRYRKRRGTTFKDLSENHVDIKDELRQSLLEEQGYICCYCGSKVAFENSIIEHLKSRHNFAELQLNYDNMMISCDGGKSARISGRAYPSHCDDYKGDKEIQVHPLMPDCECRFKFDEEGQIFCDPSDIDAKETITLLNLDNAALKHKRKYIIDCFKYLPKDHNWSGEISKLQQVTTGTYQEFCFVAKSYIETYKLT